MFSRAASAINDVNQTCWLNSNALGCDFLHVDIIRGIILFHLIIKKFAIVTHRNLLSAKHYSLTLGRNAMSAEGSVQTMDLATLGVALTKCRTVCPFLWHSAATDLSI